MEKWLCGPISIFAGLLLACWGGFFASSARNALRGTYYSESAGDDLGPCKDFSLPGGEARARFVGRLERTVFFVAGAVFGLEAGLFGGGLAWAGLKLAANWGARLKGSEGDGGKLAVCAMASLVATLVSVSVALGGGLLAWLGVDALREWAPA